MESNMNRNKFWELYDQNVAMLELVERKIKYHDQILELYEPLTNSIKYGELLAIEFLPHLAVFCKNLVDWFDEQRLSELNLDRLRPLFKLIKCIKTTIERFKPKIIIQDYLDQDPQKYLQCYLNHITRSYSNFERTIRSLLRQRPNLSNSNLDQSTGANDQRTQRRKRPREEVPSLFPSPSPSPSDSDSLSCDYDHDATSEEKEDTKHVESLLVGNLDPEVISIRSSIEVDQEDKLTFGEESSRSTEREIIETSLHSSIHPSIKPDLKEIVGLREASTSIKPDLKETVALREPSTSIKPYLNKAAGFREPSASISPDLQERFRLRELSTSVNPDIVEFSQDAIQRQAESGRSIAQNYESLLADLQPESKVLGDLWVTHELVQSFSRSKFSATRKILRFHLTKIDHLSYPLFDFQKSVPSASTDNDENKPVRFELMIRLTIEVEEDHAWEEIQNSLRLHINGTELLIKTFSQIGSAIQFFILVHPASLKLGENQIQFSRLSESSVKEFELLIELVNMTSELEIFKSSIESKCSTNRTIFLKNRRSPSSTTNSIVLTDPLTFNLIQFPVRGIGCQHLECFDLKSFIDRNRFKSDWKCPVKDCSEIIKPMIELELDPWIFENIKFFLQKSNH